MRFEEYYPYTNYLAFNTILNSLLLQNNFDPIAFEIRSIEICDSTNSFVENLFKYYTRIIALSIKQDAGRGREGRNWESPIGGIWLSIGIKLNKDFIELSTPIAETVRDVISNYYHCELKKPNDVLINNKKVAGILVESKISGNNINQIIIGIGINVHNEIPKHLVNIATRLADYCNAPSIPDLAAEITIAVLLKLQKINII